MRIAQRTARHLLPCRTYHRMCCCLLPSLQEKANLLSDDAWSWGCFAVVCSRCIASIGELQPFASPSTVSMQTVFDCSNSLVPSTVCQHCTVASSSYCAASAVYNGSQGLWRDCQHFALQASPAVASSMQITWVLGCSLTLASINAVADVFSDGWP